MTIYKSIFISDIHLGTKMSQADKVLEFLKTTESENLYLVGDIIDGWAMHKNFYWPQEHNDVIQKILRKARKGTKVIYIPGNHDEFLRSFGYHVFGNIGIAMSDLYTGVDGKKYYVCHGDQFDIVIKNAKWLAHIGSWAYDMVMYLNIAFNFFRKTLGFKPWSLSAWAKYKVKQAVSFISLYEENLSNYGRSIKADGMICGHIHHANIREIEGLQYMNCGDWVESCTALVEHLDGRWEIIRWNEQDSVL